VLRRTALPDWTCKVVKPRRQGWRLKFETLKRDERGFMNYDVLPAHRNGTEPKSPTITSEDMWWREKRKEVKEWSRG
jgi:hypothetical protein